MVEQYIWEIAETVSAALGDTLDVSSLRWLRSPNEELLPADSNLVFQIEGQQDHDDVVLLVSSARFPNTVSEGLAKADLVGSLASGVVRAHISKPLHQGKMGTQSYAVVKKIGHISENRVVRLAEKRILAPAMVTWCQNLATQTANHKHEGSKYRSLFEEPLESFIKDERTPKRIRDYASKRLDEVAGKKQEMFTVVEHGDLWMGNILFDHTSQWNIVANSKNFTVIDWRGAQIDGYPCMDVMRFLTSIHKALPSRHIALFDRYQKALGISDYDCGTYALLSLGRLVQNFEHMPPSRFISLCENTFNFLVESGRIDSH